MEAKFCRGCKHLKGHVPFSESQMAWITKELESYPVATPICELKGIRIFNEAESRCDEYANKYGTSDYDALLLSSCSDYAIYFKSPFPQNFFGDELPLTLNESSREEWIRVLALILGASPIPYKED